MFFMKMLMSKNKLCIVCGTFYELKCKILYIPSLKLILSSYNNMLKSFPRYIQQLKLGEKSWEDVDLFIHDLHQYKD